jgi:hypothetical protein
MIAAHEQDPYHASGEYDWNALNTRRAQLHNELARHTQAFNTHVATNPLVLVNDQPRPVRQPIPDDALGNDWARTQARPPGVIRGMYPNETPAEYAAATYNRQPWERDDEWRARRQQNLDAARRDNRGEERDAASEPRRGNMFDTMLSGHAGEASFPVQPQSREDLNRRRMVLSGRNASAANVLVSPRPLTASEDRWQYGERIGSNGEPEEPWSGTSRARIEETHRDYFQRLTAARHQAALHPDSHAAQTRVRMYQDDVNRLAGYLDRVNPASRVYLSRAHEALRNDAIDYQNDYNEQRRQEDQTRQRQSMPFRFPWETRISRPQSLEIPNPQNIGSTTRDMNRGGNGFWLPLIPPTVPQDPTIAQAYNEDRTRQMINFNAANGVFGNMFGDTPEGRAMNRRWMVYRGGGGDRPDPDEMRQMYLANHPRVNEGTIDFANQLFSHDNLPEGRMPEGHHLYLHGPRVGEEAQREQVQYQYRQQQRAAAAERQRQAELAAQQRERYQQTLRDADQQRTYAAAGEHIGTTVDVIRAQQEQERLHRQRQFLEQQRALPNLTPEQAERQAITRERGANVARDIDMAISAPKIPLGAQRDALIDFNTLNYHQSIMGHLAANNVNDVHRLLNGLTPPQIEALEQHGDLDVKNFLADHGYGEHGRQIAANNRALSHIDRDILTPEDRALAAETESQLFDPQDRYRAEEARARGIHNIQHAVMGHLTKGNRAEAERIIRAAHDHPEATYNTDATLAINGHNRASRFASDAIDALGYEPGVLSRGTMPPPQPQQPPQPQAPWYTRAGNYIRNAWNSQPQQQQRPATPLNVSFSLEDDQAIRRTMDNTTFPTQQQQQQALAEAQAAMEAQRRNTPIELEDLDAILADIGGPLEPPDELKEPQATATGGAGTTQGGTGAADAASTLAGAASAPAQVPPQPVGQAAGVQPNDDKAAPVAAGGDQPATGDPAQQGSNPPPQGGGGDGGNPPPNGPNTQGGNGQQNQNQQPQSWWDRFKNSFLGSNETHQNVTRTYFNPKTGQYEDTQIQKKIGEQLGAGTDERGTYTEKKGPGAVQSYGNALGAGALGASALGAANAGGIFGMGGGLAVGGTNILEGLGRIYGDRTAKLEQNAWGRMKAGAVSTATGAINQQFMSGLARGNNMGTSAAQAGMAGAAGLAKGALGAIPGGDLFASMVDPMLGNMFGTSKGMPKLDAMKAGSQAGNLAYMQNPGYATNTQSLREGSVPSDYGQGAYRGEPVPRDLTPQERAERTPQDTTKPLPDDKLSEYIEGSTPQSNQQRPGFGGGPGTPPAPPGVPPVPGMPPGMMPSMPSGMPMAPGQIPPGVSFGAPGVPGQAPAPQTGAQRAQDWQADMQRHAQAVQNAGATPYNPTRSTLVGQTAFNMNQKMLDGLKQAQANRALERRTNGAIRIGDKDDFGRDITQEDMIEPKKWRDLIKQKPIITTKTQYLDGISAGEDNDNITSGSDDVLRKQHDLLDLRLKQRWAEGHMDYIKFAKARNIDESKVTKWASEPAINAPDKEAPEQKALRGNVRGLIAEYQGPIYSLTKRVRNQYYNPLAVKPSPKDEAEWKAMSPQERTEWESLMKYYDLLAQDRQNEQLMRANSNNSADLELHPTDWRFLGADEETARQIEERLPTVATFIMNHKDEDMGMNNSKYEDQEMAVIHGVPFMKTPYGLVAVSGYNGNPLTDEEAAALSAIRGQLMTNTPESIEQGQILYDNLPPTAKGYFPQQLDEDIENRISLGLSRMRGASAGHEGQDQILDEMKILYKSWPMINPAMRKHITETFLEAMWDEKHLNAGNQDNPDAPYFAYTDTPTEFVPEHYGLDPNLFPSDKVQFVGNGQRMPDFVRPGAWTSIKNTMRKAAISASKSVKKVGQAFMHPATPPPDHPSEHMLRAYRGVMLSKPGDLSPDPRTTGSMYLTQREANDLKAQGLDPKKIKGTMHK